MDNIYQVVISNTINFNSNTMFMDIIKPKDAKRCFICVDKFNASYGIPQEIAEMFEVHCNAIRNSYRYNAVSHSVVRSDLLDTFLTTSIIVDGGFHYANFNIINAKDSWMELDMNILPQIKFTFISSSNGAFIYNLHLKIKFSE